MGYKAGELERLHEQLYDILAQLIEVCERLEIPYVIIGGTAIGAHFYEDILPWDDDIDIGMEGADYDRFIREAESVMPAGYTLQTPLNEPDTPYYFAKIRKDGTRFIPEDEVGTDIHHGVYIDIFPLDRCPDSPILERMQRSVVRVLGNAFVAAAGKLTGRDVNMLFYRAITAVLPKLLIYKMMRAAQTAFNSCDVSRVTIIRMTRDHIQRRRLHPPQMVKLGRMMVKAPTLLIEYLEWHYPGVKRELPVEKQINHAPTELDFGDFK